MILAAVPWRKGEERPSGFLAIKKKLLFMTLSLEVIKVPAFPAG